MSHSYRKTRTKDKRARAARGGRPPPQVFGGKMVPRKSPALRSQCGRDDECLLTDGHADACYADAYL